MSSPTHAERTRREGVSAVEIILADGESWGLALPSRRLYPITRLETDAFGGRKTCIDLVIRIGYPIEMRRLCDELAFACRYHAAAQVRDAFRRLAIALLLYVHDLEPTESEVLLDPSRVDFCIIAHALIPVVFGGVSDPVSTDGK
jgi:hypothetical protein